MIERNELISDIGSLLGPFVLKSKAKVSYDEKIDFGHNVGMADRMSETEEKLAFIKRTKDARKARFDTQTPMLTILGVDQGTYKQYEKRTPLPWRYIPKFCAATGVSLEWLLTGEGKGGPVVKEYPKEVPKPARKPQRRRAA